jgi:hypothetical protein
MTVMRLLCLKIMLGGSAKNSPLSRITLNMITKKPICLALAVSAALLATALPASAALVITEVDPYGSSGSSGYGADWFELTNTGTSAVSIAGDTMIDSHAWSGSSTTVSPYTSGTISVGNDGKGPAAALSIAGGATSIAAGQSVIFLESSSSAANSGTAIANFESAWFGSKVPANLAIGVYNDAGDYGLSQGASGDVASDMVNIFNGSTSSASLLASVAFGFDTGTPIATFDNTAGLNNAVITTKSAVGVNGAVLSSSGLEIGSPGIDSAVAPVPLPAAALLLVSGLGGMGMFGRKRKGVTV